MEIIVRLDVVLAMRKMKARDLADQIGISEQNVSLLRTGKVKAREGEIEYLYNLACEYGSADACAKRQIARQP